MRLAVDLGGTHLRAAVVTGDGVLLTQRKRATPTEERCPDVVADLARQVRGAAPADCAVVGVPGRVDYRRGVLEHAPNLPPSWADALRADVLSQALGLPVALANDADLAAVAEAYLGAGRGADDVAYLTLSTGVGAGVLLGRRLVAGRRSLAEVGHTVIDRHAVMRGEPASVEDLASGTALAREARAAGFEDAAGPEVQRRAALGDAAACQAWDRVVEAAAIAVTNLAFLFTPQVIVLGGGLGASGDPLLTGIREHLQRHGPPGLPEPIAVRVAELGDDAGLLGAACWREATGGGGGG